MQPAQGNPPPPSPGLRSDPKCVVSRFFGPKSASSRITQCAKKDENTSKSVHVEVDVNAGDCKEADSEDDFEDMGLRKARRGRGKENAWGDERRQRPDQQAERPDQQAVSNDYSNSSPTPIHNPAPPPRAPRPSSEAEHRVNGQESCSRGENGENEHESHSEGANAENEQESYSEGLNDENEQESHSEGGNDENEQESHSRSHSNVNLDFFDTFRFKPSTSPNKSKV
ncbi:hypothetical protein AAMO2058_001318300 [Amorphochlora amoebiformis]